MNKPKIIKFKNGATFIYQKDNRNNYSSVVIGFQAGHNYNTKNGLAHFLEHMLFNGTKNKTKEKISEVIEEIIPSLNAYTSSNLLAINFSRTNKLFEKSIEFAGEILTQTKLSEEHIKTERGVIKEEYRIKNDKSIRNLSYQHGFLLYNNKMTNEMSLGCEKDIDNITLQDLQDFHDKYFLLENFYGCYVGNLPWFKVKKILYKYVFKNVDSNINFKQDRIEREIDKEPSMQVVTNEDKTISLKLSFKFNLPFKLLKLTFEQNYLSRYFLRNKNMLYVNLRNKGLIYSCSINNSYNFDTQLFNIIIKTSKEKLMAVLKEVNKSIKYLLSHELTNEELTKLKNNAIYIWDEILDYSKMDNAVNYLDLLLNEGKGNNLYLVKTNKRIKAAKKVTIKSINDFKHKIFNKDNLPYITFMGDIKKEDLPTFKQICNIIYKGIK